MSTHRRRHPVHRDHRCTPIFGGADFGAGFWDLVAGGTKRGERPREVIDHSIAPVWEANHVWLIFVFVVLWTCFPEAYASITLTLFVPLIAGGPRHRAARGALRLPQVGVPHPGPAQLRRRLRALVGAGAVLPGRRRSAASRPGGCRQAARRATPGTAGSTRRRSSAASSPCASRRTWPAFFLVSDAGRLSDEAMVAYFRRRATGGRCGRRARVAGRDLRAVQRRRLPLRRAHLARPAPGDPLRRSGSARSCCSPASAAGARWPPWWQSAASSWPGAWRSGTTCCPTSLTVSAAAAPSGTITAGAGRHRPRRGPDRARVRAPVRARPEDPAARGGCARAGIRESETDAGEAWISLPGAPPATRPVGCQNWGGAPSAGSDAKRLSPSRSERYLRDELAAHAVAGRVERRRERGRARPCPARR